MIFTKKEKSIIIYISSFILVGGFWILFNKNYLKKTPKNVNDFNENIQSYKENNSNLTSKNMKENFQKEAIINKNKYNDNNTEPKKRKNIAKLIKKVNINTGNIGELEKLSFYYLNENKKLDFIAKTKELDKENKKIEDIIINIKNKNFEAKPGFACKQCNFKHICEYSKN